MLPLPPKPLSPSVSRHPLPVYAPSTSLNVLFVDDELFIRQLMRELLRDVGLRADTAADGFQALIKFQRGHWDIVFTDYSMPGMNGQELAQEIKKLAPTVPVIMVTGLSDLCVDGGVVDALVEKPFTREKLCGAIWHTLLKQSGREAA